MVSIIIATYNRKEKLKRAIQSVIYQTFPDWELIVVDDFSKEDPKDLVEGFNDDRIKYIRLDKNSGGPSRPRNIGIKASEGEYIGFLDDDNAYRPDHLKVLLNELDRNKELDLVYGDRYINHEGHPEANTIGVASDFDPELLMRANFIDTSDFLVKREPLFAIGGWDERYKRMLDWNLVARLDKAGYKLQHISKIITDYYVHGDGMLSEEGFKNEWCVIRYPDGSEQLGAYDSEIKLPYLGEVKEPRVACFVLTWNRLDYTMRALESLDRTAGYPIDVFIVDNGSTDGTTEWLQKFKSAVEQREEVNRGTQTTLQGGTVKESKQALTEGKEVGGNKAENKPNQISIKNNAEGIEAWYVEGRYLPSYGRVYMGEEFRPSLQGLSWICPSTQAGNGEAYWEIFRPKGSRTPHQQEQKRQPDRKSDVVPRSGFTHAVRKVSLILNDENKGISIASNQILRKIKDSGTNYDIIGKFDNDAMCMTPGWLKAMVDIYRVNHRIAMSCYISGLRDSAGGVPRYNYGKIANELIGMTKHLGGICCFTDAKVRLLFMLDENEPLHTADDLMFSKHLQKRGGQMCYLENYYINHGPSGTDSQEKDYPEYFERRKTERVSRYKR